MSCLNGWCWCTYRIQSIVCHVIVGTVFRVAGALVITQALFGLEEDAANKAGPDKNRGCNPSYTLPRLDDDAGLLHTSHQVDQGLLCEV